MVRTNHSQNLILLQSTDPNWGLEAVCQENSCEENGGYPDLLSLNESWGVYGGTWVNHTRGADQVSLSQPSYFTPWPLAQSPASACACPQKSFLVALEFSSEAPEFTLVRLTDP